MSSIHFLKWASSSQGPSTGTARPIAWCPLRTPTHSQGLHASGGILHNGAVTAAPRRGGGLRRQALLLQRRHVRHAAAAQRRARRPVGQLPAGLLDDGAHRHLRPVLCELIGQPIKQSAELIGEPIKGRAKTGTSHSTGVRRAPLEGPRGCSSLATWHRGYRAGSA